MNKLLGIWSGVLDACFAQHPITLSVIFYFVFFFLMFKANSLIFLLNQQHQVLLR